MLRGRKLNIAVIGAGKIAYSLTGALAKNGYNVSIAISREIGSAKRLALKNNIKKYSSKLEDIPAGCNLFILAVPDNQIKITAGKLLKLKLNFKESIFVHLSGALDISVLSSLKRKKAQTASLHIMQTFPSKKVIGIKNCYAAVETDSRVTKALLFEISEKLGLNPFLLKSKDKPLYHAAGVFASNFLVGLLFSSQRILKYAEIKDSDFFKIMEPIIYSTLSNIKKAGISAALSGPVERGDIQTVKGHVSSFKKLIKKDKSGIIYYLLLINYITQSMSLEPVVEEKAGRLTERHLELREYLLKELKSASVRLESIMRQS